MHFWFLIKTIIIIIIIIIIINTAVSPSSSPPGTIRQEERLRLSDRNSILMT